MKRPGASSWGTWPTPSKISRRLPGKLAMRLFGVGDRDDRVALAPDDQQRQRLGQVEAVEGGDPLAVGADHRAQGRQERLAALGVGERRVAARDLGDVGGGPQAEQPEPAAEHRARPLPDPGGGGDEEIGAGQRRRPQDRADVGAEAAAGDQHQALDHLRELVGELQRDAAAERVADQGRPLVAERQQQVAQPAGEAAQRVVAAAGRRERRGRGSRGRSRCGRSAERLDHRAPVLRGAGHAVDQQQQRSRAGLDVADRSGRGRSRPCVSTAGGCAGASAWWPARHR